MARVIKAKFADERSRPQIIPQSPRQGELMEHLKAATSIVVIGPPGTGKTYVPVLTAADRLLKGDINKIILTRPNVEAGRPLGFRPGDLQEKLNEWFAEILGLLRARLTTGVFETAMSRGSIECVPFETMRGRSFPNAFVLLDEAQNCLVPEILNFLFRVGDNSQVVVNGDIRQCDLKTDSGLRAVIDMIRTDHLPVPIVEFGVDDIVRSEWCKMWVLSAMKHGYY